MFLERSGVKFELNWHLRRCFEIECVAKIPKCIWTEFKLEFSHKYFEFCHSKRRFIEHHNGRYKCTSRCSYLIYRPIAAFNVNFAEGHLTDSWWST